MRLTPIDTPPTLLARFAYFLSRRRLGKVMTPMKVIYARVPRMFRLGYEVMQLLEKGITLDPSLRLLVQTRVAMLNHCSFCIDIARAQAVERQIGLEKFGALPEYATSPLFDERERAALAYVEEATRHKRVADASFERVRKHFSEREIVELTVLNAVENYFNLLNLPLEIEEDGLCAIAQRRSAA